MQDLAAQHLFSTPKAPLLRALTLIGPHYAEIRSAWRKKLAGAGLHAEELDALSGLTLEAHRRTLETENFQAYREELEQQAQGLQGKGLIGVHVVLAMGTYLDCCLPWTGPRRTEAGLALAHLTTAAEAVILRSYADYRAAAVRRLQERERQSFSRDLHDEIGHNLLVLKLYLEIMMMELKRGNVAELESKVAEALALVAHAIESVRRLMLDLGPAMLSQFGFARAVQIYARQFAMRTGIELDVHQSALPEELPSGHETALYRVLQGALSNVLQHSRAKHLQVHIGATKRSLVMRIEDDGCGFDVPATLAREAFGILAMRERVESLGGKFHIESWPQRPGARRHGTRIEIDVPLPAEAR